MGYILGRVRKKIWVDLRVASLHNEGSGGERRGGKSWRAFADSSGKCFHFWQAHPSPTSNWVDGRLLVVSSIP